MRSDAFELGRALAAEERARAEGEAAARNDALGIIALCDRYGRPDMVPHLVGKSIAEAKRELAGAVWDRAFSEARTRVR